MQRMTQCAYVGMAFSMLMAAAWAAPPAQAHLVVKAPPKASRAQTASAPAAATIVHRGKGSYAVVVSRGAYNDPAWRKVVDALQKHHNASVIVYGTDVWQARAPLASLMPRYACFVARPEHAGRDFVVAVHRLTRKLDADPYTDVIWGILTGYEPADALRIACHTQPLIIRRGAAATGLDLTVFDQGVMYSEGQKGVRWIKKAGGKIQKTTCPDDSTESIVHMLNHFKPDLFMTSGHASQYNWLIGYTYRNGQFRCHDGQLYGLSLAGKKYPVNSPNPKVFLPVGNCLIGDIPNRNCMALAWMHSGGADQMIGYTVPTWFGYGGWGVKDLLIGQPGRFSLAEAFFLNTQALLHEIQVRFPQSAGVNFDRYDIERQPGLLGYLAAKYHLLNAQGTGLRSRQEMGMLWDRDTVAFYGDPAWDARLAPRKLAWKQTLSHSGGTYTFTVHTRQDGHWPDRPVMMILPRRLKDIKIVQGAKLKPVVTDNFILVPVSGKFTKGQTIQVVFTAQPA